MTEQEKTCQCCGKPLSRKRYPGGRLESNSAFKKRKYCSLACANTTRPEAQKILRRNQAEQEQSTDVEPASTDQQPKTALEFLVEVINDPRIDIIIRVTAAKALLPYQALKAGENGGKKETQAGRAKNASSGRFAPSSPPYLVSKK